MEEKQTRAARPAVSPGTAGFRDDIIKGLRATPKRIPPKYFYDEAGSALFEEITRQREYYVTRTELAVLDAHAAQIDSYLPPGCVIVEFGSGSSTKIRRLLGSSSKVAGYVPVDISPEMLKIEAANIARDFPRLRVQAVAADFTRRFALPSWAGDHPLVGFFPGSTIGNFDPIDAQRLLCDAARTLGAQGLFIVGVDLIKDRAILDAAYNDAAGVTAKFNLNLLSHCNRQLGTDFDHAKFEHRAFFRPDMQRVEMHLVSLQKQFIHLDDFVFGFEHGESVHTENSYKYTISGFQDLAQVAGWQPADALTDEASAFSVHILRRQGTESEPPGYDP